MSILSTVQQGIASAIRAAGDAIVEVKVAASLELDAQPGQDYEPTWVIYDGKGFFEKVDEEDYPGTSLQQSDRTLLLMQCGYNVETHDYIMVDDVIYHVYGVKPELVGVTRVLQKLLVRQEQKAGIAWVSSDLSAA